MVFPVHMDDVVCVRANPKGRTMSKTNTNLESVLFSRRFSGQLVLTLTAGLVGLIIADLLFVILYPDFSDALNFAVNVDREGNYATWFNCTIDLLVGLAAWGIAWISANHLTLGEARTNVRAWTATGFVFVYLGMDDASQIHERFGAQARKLIETHFTGLVSDGSVFWEYRWFMWIPVFTILGCVIAFYLFRLFRQTIWKAKRAKWLVIAGMLLLASNPLTEVVETQFTLPAKGVQESASTIQAANPVDMVRLKILTLIQESTEMAGVIFILFGFLLYGEFLLHTVGTRLSLPYCPLSPHEGQNQSC